MATTAGKTITTILVLAGALTTATARAAHAEMEFSVYSGAQSAADGEISVSGLPDFDASWEGKSFTSPLYYGARATWWLENFNMPDWGVSLDFAHAKVYADDETLALTPGWSRLEFTDGLNLLTLNGLYRFTNFSDQWTPYLGAGAGINIPHVEVTRPSGETFEYQFGGATLQAQAGISYAINDHWSVFGEYKGNYSFVDVDIDSGDRLTTEIFTNAVNVGVSFRW